MELGCRNESPLEWGLQVTVYSWYSGVASLDGFSNMEKVSMLAQYGYSGISAAVLLGAKMA